MRRCKIVIALVLAVCVGVDFSYIASELCSFQVLSFVILPMTELVKLRTCSNL